MHKCKIVLLSKHKRHTTPIPKQPTKTKNKKSLYLTKNQGNFYFDEVISEKIAETSVLSALP